MNDAEQWKVVPGYPSYKVSNFGNVHSSMSGVLHLQTTHRGYARVTLYCDKKAKSFVVHKLVLLAFIGERTYETPIIRHLDGNKLNNILSNLRYGTYAENEKDKEVHGRALLGEKHPRSKLTLEDVKTIIEIYIPGDKQFGAKALAAVFNVCPAHISDIAHKKNWSKTLEASAALAAGGGEADGGGG